MPKYRVSTKEIKYIQSQTLATLKIEGLEPSQQAININLLFLKGYIDSNTAIKQIIKFYVRECWLMKTRYKKVKRTREEIINDKWLKIHITAHRITKSKDNNEIEKMRKSNRQTLKSINRLKSLMQGGKANGKNKSWKNNRN